jgi:hypothetical protein
MAASEALTEARVEKHQAEAGAAHHEKGEVRHGGRLQ